MPNATPQAALALAHASLLGALPDARAIQDDGPRKHRLALGLMAAEPAAAKGTEAGCVAAITALAGVQDVARALDGADNPKVQRCAKAAEGILQALRAIVWTQPLPILTVQGFATVAVSASAPVTATATLLLSAPAGADVTVMVTITGLVAADVADGLLSFPVRVPAGSGPAPLPLTFAAQALTADKAASLALSGAAGATLGTPAGFPFALKADTVVQPPPTLTLSGPGDVAASATAEVDAAATVTLSAPTDHDVTATYTLTGQQDGDLLSPATGPVVVPAGQPSAAVAIRVAPLTLTADRALTLALSGIVGAAEPFPAAVMFALKANAVVTKGTLTFAAPIGTVLRAPAAETTVMVEVAREGVSTHDAATIPAVDIALPPNVLKVVGPAEFGAGQRIGHAPMVLHPYGAGARLGAVRTTPGKADLVPTADFDLGSVPSQDFVVQDGQAGGGTNLAQDRVPDGASKVPFKVVGFSMNVTVSDGDLFENLTGHRPLVAAGGSHRADGSALATPELMAGVRLSKNLADYDDVRNILRGGQLDINGTGLATSFAIIKASGAGFVVPMFETRTRVAPPTWQQIADGVYDEYDYAQGRMFCALMRARGIPDGMAMNRDNKEGNGGGYDLTAAVAKVYAQALGRRIHNWNQGYADGGATQPCLWTLGFARHDQLGPLADWVPVYNGTVMVQFLDVSMHPPGHTFQDVFGKPFPDQVAAVRSWIRGAYEPGRTCYAPDHSDPQYSAKAVALSLGIGVTNVESAPREDKYYCEIPDAAWQALFDWWSENAALVGAVGLYKSSCLDKAWTGMPPGWPAGVDRLVALLNGA